MSALADAYAAALAGPTVITLSKVQPALVTWLWPGRLPAGKLVVLDGDPAVGKSTLSLDVAARVSTGSPWPDGAGNRPPGHVLILSAEDGLADTIRPRLDAAGADVTKIHALTEIRYIDDGNTRARPVTLADLDEIEQAIVQVGARLVVVDVLMAYLPGKVDSHRDQDIRSVLSELKALAERTGCCILLLRHLNKATGGNALYRGGGSIAIVGSARTAWLAAVDPDDEARRVLAVYKTNLAAEQESLAYRLVDSADHGCARIEWLGTTGHRGADLLGRREDDDDRHERDEAVAWLTSYLSDCGGESAAVDVKRAARAVAISDSTLHRARKTAGAVTERRGFGKGAAYLWKLPTAPCIPHGFHGFQDSEGGIHDTHVESMAPDTLEPSGPEIGPCTRCGAATRRYGDHADPLCRTCRAAS